MFDHRTSRLCDDPKCRGVLNDSIINFGENLPQSEVKKAFDHAEKVCMCICGCVCVCVCMCMCMGNNSVG